MKELDIENWNRKDHFRFFSQFEEPFFGVTVNIECGAARQNAKQHGVPFFQYYLYRALKAANGIEPFRYRIIDGKVFVYDVAHASPTINRADGTFGFAYVDYHSEEAVFYAKAREVIEKVQETIGLIPASEGQNVIHFSALPWVQFTSLSHARSFTFPDSCPKVSFGKLFESDGKEFMPVSIHVHHGLMDGYHVGLFVEAFQRLMLSPD